MNRKYAILYIVEKVRANLKAEIASNYLGVLWWFIQPALFVCVFYLVFGLLFNRGGEGFLQILIVGIVAWLWFATSVNKSVMSIMGAKFLMAQVYLPKYCMPATVVIESIVKQVAVCAVLLIFLWVTSDVYLSWWWLPIIFMIQAVMNAAVAFWVAALVPFVPDIRFMVTAGLQMLMFCSGVFFRSANVPEEYQFIMEFNPMANIITQYRQILVYGENPDVFALTMIAGGSTGVLFFALLFLRKFDLQYPRLIN